MREGPTFYRLCYQLLLFHLLVPQLPHPMPQSLNGLLPVPCRAPSPPCHLQNPFITVPVMHPPPMLHPRPLCHLQVDVTEYMFKLALLQRKYDQVIQMIKGSALCGSAIIRWATRDPTLDAVIDWKGTGRRLAEAGVALLAVYDNTNAPLHTPLAPSPPAPVQLPASQGVP